MSAHQTIRVAVIGASGYGGGELLRLLSNHPSVELTVASSKTYAGRAVSASFPGFRHSALRFEAIELADARDRADVFFLAQENGFAMQQAGALLTGGKKVIDLSADFRLKRADAYPLWYRNDHKSPDLLSRAVYGLPELHREQIRGASLLANPGCYPTASILGFTPLLEQGVIEPGSIIIDAKSGVSGAGRSKHILDYHFPELNESVRAYAIAGAHRHTPEIEQELGLLAGQELTLSFTPHLMPITRGILMTGYALLKKSCSSAELVSLYRQRYEAEPFVVVYDDGQLPVTKATYGSNYCHIGLAVDKRTNRVTVVSAIDNLVKGAAGQAVQNMNLMLGLPEAAGLSFAGVWP